MQSIGPVIKLEGEAEFKRAINDINTNLKTLGTSMKASTAEFDKNDKSVKKLSQQNQILGSRVNELKTKLSQQNEMLAKATAAYGSADEKTQKYQQAVNLTTAALKTAERQIEQNNQAMDNYGRELVKNAANSEQMTNAKKRLGDALNVVKVAAIAAVGAIGTLAYKAGAAADDINTLSKQTGLSTEEIQKFKYASEMIDVPLETLTGSMAKLTRNMESARNGSKNQAQAFKELGVMILDNNGKLRSNQDVFSEVIKSLEKMENETQRDAYAMQIFGKSAQALNPLILGGADALKQYGDEAQQAGLILSQDALDGANKLNDAIDVLKATMAGVFMKAGAEIATEFAPFLEDLAQKAKNVDFTPVINALKWLIDNGKTIASIALGIGAGMVAWNVAQTVYAVVQAIQVWRGAMEAAKVAQVGLNIAMANNPIGLIITLVTGLAAALVGYKAIAGQSKAATDDLTKSYEDNIKSIDDNIKSIDDNTASQMANANKAEILRDKLFELDDQVQSGTLSDEDATQAKTEMGGIIDQLNSIIPGLCLNIDAETGRLSVQRDEVNRLTTAFINLTRAKAMAAAYQAKIDAAAKTIADADEVMSKNPDRIVEYKFNSPSEWGTYGIGSERAVNNPIYYDAYNAREKAEKDLDGFIGKLNEQNEIIQSNTESADDLGNSINDLGNGFTGVGAKAEKAGKAIKDTSKDTTKAERDAAREQEQIEREKTKAFEQERDKRFKDLKYKLDMQFITEKDYYKELSKLTAEYFAEGTDGWQQYTNTIYNYHFKTFEDIKSKVTDEMKKIYGEQDNLTSKLQNYASLFETTTTTIKGQGRGLIFENGAWINEADIVDTKNMFTDMEKVNEELENYWELLQKVNERDGDNNVLYNALRKMDIKDAVANAEVILNATDEELTKRISDYERYQKLSAGIGESAYADDIFAVVANAMKEATDELQDMMTDYEGLGEDYATSLGKGFMRNITGVFAEIRASLSSEMQSLGLVTDSQGITASGSAAVSSTWSPTINLYGSNVTAAQAFSETYKQGKIDEMRGLKT